MKSKKRFPENLKVALVDDFLTVDGGAQKVLRVLHDMWPEAPVFTVTYFPEKFNPRLEGWDIRTSFVSKFPFSRKLEQQYKLFYPQAVEMLDLSGFDLVISNTYAGYAKAVIVDPDCLHISYVHTVPRFLWGYRTSRHEQVGLLYKKIILPPLEHYWRIWDRQTSVRPDVLMANSKNIAERVWKCYRRDSEVMYPPVEIDALLEVKRIPGDHFIYFGRLEKYKCVDMAIRACVAAGAKLKIVGTGNYEGELKELAASLDENGLVEFVGWVTDQERNNLIAAAKAFIFPGPDEDFGIVLVESFAAGTPVIAFDSGGAGEILADEKTGVLLSVFDQKALDTAVAEFDAKKYDPEVCRNRAKEFDVHVFRQQLKKLILRHI